MAATFDLDPEYNDLTLLTGIDEAGRGCLAGPVVAAAVSWQPAAAARRHWYGELADSKTLTAEQRDRLYPYILKAADRVRIALVSPPLIDYLNILKATLHGFELVAPRASSHSICLIDGNQKPPSLPWAATIVKGDNRVGAIAAAGILAKVFRDRLMIDLAQRVPHFGFESHKGYATVQHRKALVQHGAGPFHRKSYRPVGELTPQHTEADQNMIDRLGAAPPSRLPELWQRFRNHYQDYSLTGAKKILDAFQAGGFRVLPHPNDRWDFET